MAVQLYWCIFILAFSLCHGSITNKPADIEACVGEDVNIPWTYDDNDADIGLVKWSGGSTTIMTYLSGVHTPRNSYNVVNNGNGNITLSSVPIGYTDPYKITVSALTNSEDVVDVTVCAASAGLTSSKSGQTITCAASELGTPAATLSIWIDGVEQSSSSATVTDLNEVSCCLTGCAVSCMNGGSSSVSQNCTIVQAGKVPCGCTVCAIILLILVIIVAAADIIMIAYLLYLLYLLYHAKADGDGDGLSTFAIVGIVSRIIVAVGIIVNIIVCVVTLEPTCSLSICAILGIVIGSIDDVAIIAVIVVYVIIKKTGDTDKGGNGVVMEGHKTSADKP